ncbi:MAG: hypothetical protein ACRD1R_00270 [Acidobacteriota bacterium]
MRFPTPALLLLLALPLPLQADARKHFSEWTLQEAVKILTDSPWAKQHTSTRVVGGIGSGVQGEKEIYNTFFIRFLSALPIREALARVQQIQQGYDELSEEEKREFDADLASGLDMDVSRWIVMTVSFRSNNRESEREIRRFLQTQTVETLKNRVYLSTDQFMRVDLVAYFPPRGDVVGAKFLFPREIDGEATVWPEDGSLTFQLDLPGPGVTVTFPVFDMIVDSELII